MKTYTHEFTIRIHDVDAAGIVFFAQYLVFWHDAYEAFLADIGHSIHATIAAGEYIIPIKRCEADYHRPMRHGETIRAHLRLAELRGSSFVVTADFVGTDDVRRATITTRHVCVDTKSMEPVPVPEGLRAALEPYCH